MICCGFIFSSILLRSATGGSPFLHRVGEQGVKEDTKHS
ncbi:BnaC04g31960D [Brassica napus]|uniref:BnaC04g31960D protein n=1 Tax=Brassica napus TaxID=3708 RepID=A0A078GUV6_BRANA|nr:BnaC04g31960D [Brassica napus]